MSRDGIRRAVGLIAARAAQLLELHAVPRERRGGARQPAATRGWRTSRSSTSATGTPIPGSSRPTPSTIAGATREAAGGAPRSGARSSSRPTASRQSMAARDRVPAPAGRVSSRRSPARLGTTDFVARLPEPERPARRSVARPGRLRLSARANTPTGWRPRSSARSASSAITSKCSTTSTSRPRRVCREIGLPMARAGRRQQPSQVHRDPGGRGPDDGATVCGYEAGGNSGLWMTVASFPLPASGLPLEAPP